MYALMHLHVDRQLYALHYSMQGACTGGGRGDYSHPSREREKLYYKEYHITGYTASQCEGFIMSNLS